MLELLAPVLLGRVVKPCYLVSPRGAGACAKDRQRQVQNDGYEILCAGFAGF